MKRSVRLAAAAGWLVPGAGHWMAGQRAKGLVLGLIILALFTAGLLMKGAMVPAELAGSLHSREWIARNIVSAISLVMRMGCGLPAILAAALRWGGTSNTLPYYEIGGVYTAVAGALNLLAVFSLFDSRAREEHTKG